MPKKGTQIHDEYWRHYIAIPKHSKKSDLGKKHAQLFREYKYKKIIGELVDNSNLTLECADIKLSKEETVDIIFYLFYPLSFSPLFSFILFSHLSLMCHSFVIALISKFICFFLFLFILPT